MAETVPDRAAGHGGASARPAWSGAGGTDGRLGSASIGPTGPVAAGSQGTWQLTYTVGPIGIDEDGGLMIAFPFVSDWGVPQFDDPGSPEYATVSCSGKARVVARFDAQAHVRPFQRAIVVRVRDGYLGPGDTVTVVLGDTSGGSAGSTAQSFCVSEFEFRALVDAFGTGLFLEVPVHGTLAIIPGAVTELVAIAPSEAVVSEPFPVFVKGQDLWGNPTDRLDGDLLLGGDGIELRQRERSDGAVTVHVVATAPGILRVEVSDPVTGLRTRTNPVRVIHSAAGPRHYWGDLHTQSGETIGTKPVDEYLRFARDKARLDFVGHQANDFQITSEIWSAITAAMKNYHDPGRFVTFNGYEWSGLTCAGGDHNVMFRGDDVTLRRSGHWQIDDPSDADTDCYPVSELYRAFRDRDDVMLIPHVGGRYADLTFHDPRLERLVEISSTHGEFEWLYADAIAAGARVGVTCGSDDHTGRPGASYPGGAGLGLKGGLLCLLSPGLTREELWASLERRACYGSTAGRLLLDVDCDGTGIGGELACDQPPVFRVSVAGTDDIERIELRAGTEVVDTYPRRGEVARDHERLRISWKGARHKGRGRAARWDGHARLLGTTIKAVSTYAFDTPREGVTGWDAQSVHWTSTTRGDFDGLVLQLSDPRGRLEFRTGPVSFDCDLGALKDACTNDGGGLGLAATAEWLPRTAGPDVSAELRGAVPSGQAVPYQVVVIQRDGTKAWSSPIWVSAASRS